MKNTSSTVRWQEGNLVFLGLLLIPSPSDNIINDSDSEGVSVSPCVNVNQGECLFVGRYNKRSDKSKTILNLFKLQNIATLKLKLIFCSYRVYSSNSSTSIASTTTMIATTVVVAAIHSSLRLGRCIDIFDTYRYNGSIDIVSG